MPFRVQPVRLAVQLAGPTTREMADRPPISGIIERLRQPIQVAGDRSICAVMCGCASGDLAAGEVHRDQAAHAMLRGIEERVVFVAPDPIHASLPIRHHEGMSRLLEVLQGMLVLGLFAATNMTAGQAHAQRRPRFTQIDASVAHLRLCLDVIDHMEVST